MGFFDNSGSDNASMGEFKLITIGAAVAVGAFVVIGALRNRSSGATTAATAAGPVSGMPSASGAQSNTVYIPVTGPTDVQEVQYTDSYNQQSPVVNAQGATSPVTVSPAGPVTTTTTNTTTPAPVVTPPVVVVPPTTVIYPAPPERFPVDPPIKPPTPQYPWYYGMLQDGPGGRSYYRSQGETLQQIAQKFTIGTPANPGWVTLAYNVHNQALENGTFLSQSYKAQGHNTIPAGTLVWITQSAITRKA